MSYRTILVHVNDERRVEGLVVTSWKQALAQLAIAYPDRMVVLDLEVAQLTALATAADGALRVTLPPGNYTAQVSGVGSTTGTALIEIYEVL